MQNRIKIIWVTIVLCNSSCILIKPVSKVAVEHQERRALIAASQAGAMPVFFNPDDLNTPLITPGHFKDSMECLVRGGLPNFFQKVKTGKPVTIGYIGGSITRANDMYRNQSAKFIQHVFPSIKMKAVNAGIAGTGTDLGACRIHDQLLKYYPDLIFIEFAVNGAFRPGMEGMIRQIWKFNPYIDICLLYTIHGSQYQIYGNGQIPDNIQGLEKIADYYHIPSVHMGLEPSMLEKRGKLLWRAPADSATKKIIFSEDGIHPLKAGGDLYASAIARAMIKMGNKGSHPDVHHLPPPLLVNNWEDAKMLDPKKTALFSKGWTAINPLKTDSLGSFTPWFPYIMKSCVPSASFTFRFRGTMVGLFDIGGPEAGQLLLTVDNGRGKKLINRFNKWCNNRYRGQCFFVSLPLGVHIVTFKISTKKSDKAQILGGDRLEDFRNHPERYNQTVEWLGKILIRGEVLPLDK